MEHFEITTALNDLLSSIGELGRSSLDIPERNIHIAKWPSLMNMPDDALHEMLRQIILDNELKDGDDGRTTRSYPGVIEVSEDLMDKFSEVNELKGQFQSLLVKIRKTAPHDHRKFVDFLKNGAPDRDERYLVNFGRASINHLERKFPLLEKRPQSISYSWSSRSSSIVRVSKKMAIKALLELNESLPHHLMRQMEVLGSLPDSEPLARVIKTPAGIKANIVFNDGSRKTVKPGLPFIVPEGNSLIRMKFITEGDVTRKSTRLVRSDRKIEETPIAPSIHVYRYREDCRTQ